MNINFEWNYPMSVILSDTTGGKKGRLFLANEAKRLMNDYVPADNLMLAQNVRVYLESDRGIVHYMSPYAHYQYIGKLYVDPKTKKGAFYSPNIGFWSRKNVNKIKTGKNLDYSTFRHPLASSHWDKAMMTARGDDLAKSYEKYLGGK